MVFVSNTAASIPTAVVGSGHLVVVSVAGTGAVMLASVTTSLNLTNVSLVVGTAVDCALTVAYAENVGRHVTSKSANSSSGGFWVAVASCLWNVNGVSRFRGVEVRTSALMGCPKVASASSDNSTAVLISSTNISVTTAQYDSHAVLVFACNSSADGATRLITVNRSQIVLSATAVVDTAWTSAYIAAQWMAVYGLVASSVLRLPVACGLTLIQNRGIAVTVTVSANVTVRRTLTQSGGVVVADSTTVAPGFAVNTGASIVYIAGGAGQVTDMTLRGWLTSSTDTVVVDGDGTVETVTFDGAQVRVLALQGVVTVGGGASGIHGTLIMSSVTATCGSAISVLTAHAVMPRRVDVNYCNLYGVSSLLNAALITTASVDVNVGKSVVTCASKASSSAFVFLALMPTSQIDVLLDGTSFVQCGKIATLSQLGLRNVSFNLRCVPWDTPTNYIMPKQAAPYFSPFLASVIQFAGNSGNVSCVTGTLEPTLTQPSPSISVTASLNASMSASSTSQLTRSESKTQSASQSISRNLSLSRTVSVGTLSDVVSASMTVTGSTTATASASLSVSGTMSNLRSSSVSSTVTASESATITLSKTASLSVSLSHSQTGSMTESHHRSATRAVTLSRSASPSSTPSVSDTSTITRSLSVSIDPCNTTFRSSPSAFLSSVAVAYPADGGPGVLNVTDALFYTLDRVSFAAAEHIDIVVVLNTQLRNMYGVTSASWFPLPDVTDNCISGGYRIVNDTTFVMTLSYDSDVSLRVRRVSPYLCNVTFSTDVFQCQLMTNFTFNFSLAMLVTGTPENVDPLAAMALRWIGLAGNLPQGPAVLQQSRFQVLMALADCQFSLVDELDVATHPLTFGFGSDQGYYLRGCVVGNIAFVLCLGLLMVLFLALYAAVASVVQGRTFREKFVYLLGRTGFPGILILPIGLTYDGLVSSSVTVIVHPIDPQDKLIGGVGLGFSIMILVGVAAVAIRVDGLLERRRVAVEVKLAQTHPLARRRADRCRSSSVLVRIKRILRHWVVGVAYEPLGDINKMHHIVEEPNTVKSEGRVPTWTLAADTTGTTANGELPQIAYHHPDDAVPMFEAPVLDSASSKLTDPLVDIAVTEKDPHGHANSSEEPPARYSDTTTRGVPDDAERNFDSNSSLDWLFFGTIDVVEKPLHEVDTSEDPQAGVELLSISSRSRSHTDVRDEERSTATVTPTEPVTSDGAMVVVGSVQQLPIAFCAETSSSIPVNGGLWYKMFEPIMENRVALFVVVELLVSMVNAIVVGIGISKRPLCFKLSIVSCVSYFVYFVALITVRPSATRLLLATNIALSFLNFVAALLIVCSMAMSLVQVGDIAQKISFGASVLSMAQVLPTSLAIVAASRKYYIKKFLQLRVSSEDDESSTDAPDNVTALSEPAPWILCPPLPQSAGEASQVGEAAVDLGIADNCLNALVDKYFADEIAFPPISRSPQGSEDARSCNSPVLPALGFGEQQLLPMDVLHVGIDSDVLFSEMLARTQLLNTPTEATTLLLYELPPVIAHPGGDLDVACRIDWTTHTVELTDEATNKQPQRASRKREASVRPQVSSSVLIAPLEPATAGETVAEPLTSEFSSEEVVAEMMAAQLDDDSNLL